MHAGYLRTNCTNCHRQEPEVINSLGCNPTIAAESPSWSYYEGERIISYHNCPQMFIPQTVFNFYKVYKGYQRNRFSIPLESNQPHKYLSMCDAYEHSLQNFQSIKNEEAQRQQEINKLNGMRF